MDNNHDDDDFDRIIVEQVLLHFAYHRFVNGFNPVAAYNAVREDVELGDIVENMIARAATVGYIPGVYVGDEFLSRAEMHLVGLHDHLMRGISLGLGMWGQDIATCVVAVYQRHNIILNNDLLIYGGQGGFLNLANNVFHIRVLAHQRWTRRNVAMFNSIEEENPIRLIIRTLMEDETYRYIYVGLFEVFDSREILSEEGFIVIEFFMRRLYM